jgi:1,2-diacylglycerol 3-alpha-glucosyltransferase
MTALHDKCLKIILCCPGVGHIRRGYESFTEELFLALTAQTTHKVVLFKGAGVRDHGIIPLPCVKRDTQFAAWLASRLSLLMRRQFDVYDVEQLTFGGCLLGALVIEQPDIILVSDKLLAKFLNRFRRLLPHTTLIFSNGGPTEPPFYYADLVQHLTPVHLEEALIVEANHRKHVLLPYGFSFENLRPGLDGRRRYAARQWLNIAQETRVVVSVGQLSKGHKRMDYVIKEIANSVPDVVLLLAGQRTSETSEIEKLADRLLTKSRIRIITVPHSLMADVYAAGDVFVLGSLREGFGRVVVEAIGAGLPVALNDHPIFRFVAGTAGEYGDFTVAGELGAAVNRALKNSVGLQAALARSDEIAGRFSWNALLPQYSRMLESAVEKRRN